MSVWYCLPSARADGGTIAAWRRAGYDVAVWRDIGAPEIDADMIIRGTYPGYALATNHLIHDVLRADRYCDWVVAGGDDVMPDPDHDPNDIASECTMHFGSTFGVMQPVGDSWGEDEPWAIRAYPKSRRRYIERICGSPWIGREFCERMYQGRGPFWPEFYHQFVDEHMQAVCEKLGVLWQRYDLTHYHAHALRVHETPVPPWVTLTQGQDHWREAKAIFERLQAGGFAEAHDLLEVK